MTKLIFLGVYVLSAIFCGTLGADSPITKSMKEFKIIPEIISGSVPELLKVTYEGGIQVDMGNKISPTQAKNQPEVDWDADENGYYTLIFIDADAPSPEDPYMSPIVTWMVGNIPEKDIGSGEVLTAYIPVSPPRGRGFHRGVFFLYKQPGKLVFDEEPIDKYTINGRTNFSVKDFSEKYGLGEPKAGNFYLSEFDPFVMDIYKQLNCCFELNKPE